ncbi:MAG: mannose-1-phosphate guanylyltransferase [Polyangia bacterium]|jgi:mannose-1-phosphate guanylyltransferase|nr:mannose-1-phosphate guanylyltransferase [Polyangia bacterium]
MPEADPDLFVVLMAGGSGTRLWPLSTGERPKQLLSLAGERSLLQQTLDRALRLAPPERVLVLTSSRFLPAVIEQLPELPEGLIVAEPVPRDTAGAVALAAAIGRGICPGAVMAVLPADHLITTTAPFVEAVRSAARGAASSEALYTFGIEPDHPATGYGYLEQGEQVDAEAGHFQLLRFREKPDLATAEAFLASGRFLWNSGIFVWRTEVIWREIERHLPGHASALGSLSALFGRPGFEEALAEAFAPLPKISIDFAVMEKAADVRMLRAGFDWCDVGGWPALSAYLPKDQSGNAHRCRLEALQARDNLVFCEDPTEVVALIGVEGLVVVRAGARTLVVPAERAQDIKALVDRMGAGS